MEAAPNLKTTKLFHRNYNPPSGIDLIINRGGTSSGKTIAILQSIACTLQDNAGKIATVVGQDIPNLKLGAMRDMENIIEDNPIIKTFLSGPFNKTDKYYRFKNGSILEFKSFDDGQDAKNGKRDYAFFNEVNGIKYEIFKEVYRRTNSLTWVDFNPSAEFWLQEDKWEERPGVRILKSTYKHNQFIHPKTRKKIEGYEPTPENIKNNTANEYEWKVYGMGEYAALEGAIFKNWVRGNWDESLQSIFGVDWGTTDPTVMLEVSINEKNKRIYLKEHLYRPTESPRQIKKLFRPHVTSKDLIIADNSEMHIINELRTKDDNGVWFNIRPAFKPRITERIRWVQEYQIVLCGECPNVEKELNNYIWADKKSNTPIDDWNHAMDALGYVVTYWRMNITRGRS